jgi:hypothetical protein
MLRGSRIIRRPGFIAIIAVFAVLGAHSLNPRELYNEMYPVETLKRDTFRICHEANPSFIRAVKNDREACFDSMPNAIEVALGRIPPAGEVTVASLLDPAHQAELLIQLAAIPPRQPVTVPRSFSNTALLQPLAPCAKGNAAAPGVPGLPPAPGSGRAASLNTTVLGNLPPLPSNSAVAWQAQPGLPLAPGVAGTDNGTAFDPVSTPDVGDKGPPAIVPLAPGTGCNDGA